MNNNNKTSTHHHHHHSHKGGATSGQACAACKYQRRKCAPDCILAPYFPHDRQRQFLNAHKLFGVSNITKIIRKLDQPQKDEAMRTIIFQSDVRSHDPVGGCYRVIKELQRQIDFCQAELNIVHHQLALCRAQSQQAVTTQEDNQSQINNINGQDDPDPTPTVLDYSSNEHDNQEPQGHALHDEQRYDDIFGQMGNHNDDHHHHHVVALEENDSWGMQNSGSGSLEAKQPSSSIPSECKEMKQLFLNDLDIPTDEEHSFRFEFEFDETIQPPCSSDKIIFHDETDLRGSFKQNHQDHDLKGAATFFSLTNCTSY